MRMRLGTSPARAVAPLQRQTLTLRSLAVTIIFCPQPPFHGGRGFYMHMQTYATVRCNTWQRTAGAPQRVACTPGFIGCYNTDTGLRLQNAL